MSRIEKLEMDIGFNSRAIYTKINELVDAHNKAESVEITRLTRKAGRLDVWYCPRCGEAVWFEGNPELAHKHIGMVYKFVRCGSVSDYFIEHCFRLSHK